MFRVAGKSSEAQVEIKRPKKQIAGLVRVTEILRSASVFFATELGFASPRLWVEFVCRTMRAAEGKFLSSRGYPVAKSRPASARTLSDQLLGDATARLHAENFGVYGVRKMHRLFKRQGWTIGRDQTGRLMRSQRLRVIKRSKAGVHNQIGSFREVPDRPGATTLPRRRTTQTLSC